ncbi:MAG: hypothetical protein Q9181_001124 [Wetmoreana brouardii]
MFLSLPPEIRQMIYHEVLDQQSINIKWSYSKERKRKLFSSNASYLGILYVCRLIRTEASMLFYAKTRFVFDFGINPIYGINAFVRNIGSENAALIQKVSVDDLAIYSSARTMWWHHYRTSLQKVGRWTPKFPNLKEVRLVQDQIFVAPARASRPPDHLARRATLLLQDVVVLLETDCYKEFSEVPLSGGHPMGGHPTQVWNHGHRLLRLVLDGSELCIQPYK